MNDDEKLDEEIGEEKIEEQVIEEHAIKEHPVEEQIIKEQIEEQIDEQYEEELDQNDQPVAETFVDEEELVDDPELPNTSEHEFVLPPSTAKPFSGSPLGIRRGDDDDRDVIDAMAGRNSVFGYGEVKIMESAMQAVEDLSLLGHDSATESLATLIQRLSNSPTDSSLTSVVSFAHRDLAVEAAITLARSQDDGKRFRTIAFSGSDHGRTGVCRTASGLPSLRNQYGPMMAGFAHVQTGDLDAIKLNIDDQTGCILISPMQIHTSARPLDAEFLFGVRDLCDQHGLLLAVDESEMVFGSCGTLLATSSIADVSVDLAIVSAGLFAGMPGGLLLSASPIGTQDGIEATDNPIATAVAAATIDEMIYRDLLASAAETSHQFAVDVAEAIAGYDFVRDIAQLGASIGIETDIKSNLLVDNASHFGLNLTEAGETAVRMALPLSVGEKDLSELSRRMAQTFAATEMQSAAVNV